MNHLSGLKNIYKYFVSQLTPMNSSLADFLFLPLISSPFEGRIAIKILSWPNAIPTRWEKSIRNSLSSSVISFAVSIGVFLLKILWQITKIASSMYSLLSVSPMYEPAQGIIVVPPNLSVSSLRNPDNLFGFKAWKELSYFGIMTWYWRSILSTGLSGNSLKCSITTLSYKKEEKMSRENFNNTG